MTVVDTGMEGAVAGLAAVGGPPPPGVAPDGWRRQVRQRMAEVRDALLAEAGGSTDGWLVARGGTAHRERDVLLGRLAALDERVPTDDVETVTREVDRLAHDLAHHLQRLHDLAYDEVELELGGSD